VWQDILKKTKTDEILENWFKIMDEDTDKATYDKIWVWFNNLSRDELYEARETRKYDYDDENYQIYLDTLQNLIDIINDAELEEKDKEWVKANPEKAKERDKKREEREAEFKRESDERRAKQEVLDRKIWESHARAKTAQKNTPKRKGQRRRR
tara:strand:- start:184 stop:642 length:459 start_codon:yes stop_codon:yes gene_type:complete